MMMSVLQSSGDNNTHHHDHHMLEESFHSFFEIFLSEQSQHLKELVEASESSTQQDEHQLPQLIQRVVQHYEYYYKTKSIYARQDVLSMLSPSWRSTLEEAFLWIGGWRPSMAVHLLYSKSGIQFEAKLPELIQGLRTCDLGDLSASQLAQVDAIQRRTIKEEREITDIMARHQETVADVSMVELSHVVSEMIRENNESDESKEVEERVESALTPKEEGLEGLLLIADDLRLRTIRGIVDVLTPKQGVHFLIAAAELHLRIHEWGKKKDDAKKGNEGGSHDGSSSI